MLCLLLFATIVAANTEKAIFIAPEKVNLPQHGPTLAALHIDALSPSVPQIRSYTPVTFANVSSPKGSSSWYFLHGLSEGTRYEIRICWPASQPTSWHLETFTLEVAVNTPDLIQDLARYAEGRNNLQGKSTVTIQSALLTASQSAMLLRTWGAAEFFTLEKQMMQDPPPVHVDIILDPYLFNAFPRSLLPTAAYIACVAVLGWVVSDRVWKWLEAHSLNGKLHVE